MRIHKTCNIKDIGSLRPNPPVFPSLKTMMIGAWRDGGIGDSIAAYCVLMAIKKAYPTSIIEFLSPHQSFLEIVSRVPGCSARRVSYRDIFKLEHSWKKDYDAWFSLRPRTYSVYSENILQYSGIADIASVSMKRQNDFYGVDMSAEQNSRDIAESKLYGSGDIEFMKVYNYIHNLGGSFSDAKDALLSLMPRCNIEPNKPYITFHQWAFTGRGTFNSKFWPVSYWQELARLVKSELQMDVYQVGNGNEHHLGGQIINILGKTSFYESLSFISNACLHVDIEGSLIHACAALGLPAISLVGPSMKYWRHQDSSIKYLVADPEICDIMECEKLECGWHYHCRKKNGYALCMEAITPDMVFDEIKNMI